MANDSKARGKAKAGDLQPIKHHPLKAWRFKYGLSQTAAAQRFECSKEHLCVIERGRYCPGLALAIKIVKATGGEISYEDLLAGSAD